MKIEIIPNNPKYEALLDIHKPIPANKFLPEWYKKLGLGNALDTRFDGKDFVTAKKCPASLYCVEVGPVRLVCLDYVTLSRSFLPLTHPVASDLA